MALVIKKEPRFLRKREDICFQYQKNSMYNIVRGWYEQQQVVVGYNQHDRICNNYLPGGTGIITQGDVVMKVASLEQDPRKLGQWVSILYKRKQNIKMRVVLLCFPVFTTRCSNKKVHCQQHR